MKESTPDPDMLNMPQNSLTSCSVYAADKSCTCSLSCDALLNSLFLLHEYIQLTDVAGVGHVRLSHWHQQFHSFLQLHSK